MHLKWYQIGETERARIGSYHLLRLLHEYDLGVAIIWHTLQSSG